MSGTSVRLQSNNFIFYEHLLPFNEPLANADLVGADTGCRWHKKIDAQELNNITAKQMLFFIQTF